MKFRLSTRYSTSFRPSTSVVARSTFGMAVTSRTSAISGAAMVITWRTWRMVTNRLAIPARISTQPGLKLASTDGIRRLPR